MLSTTASFSVDGVYTLRLTADDGALTATDDVIITVDPAASGSDVIYLSSSSNGNVGGVAFRDEDIVAYDPNTDSWSLLFDGSDVELGGVDINAFVFLSDGRFAPEHRQSGHDQRHRHGRRFGHSALYSDGAGRQHRRQL
ncbi:MAG: hypothetical protein R2911_15110 [Caldilineaceae bacterium]